MLTSGEETEIIEILEKVIEIHYGEEPGNMLGDDLLRRIKDILITLRNGYSNPGDD